MSTNTNSTVKEKKKKLQTITPKTMENSNRRINYAPREKATGAANHQQDESFEKLQSAGPSSLSIPMSKNIQVVVRARPLFQEEKNKGIMEAVSCEPSQSVVKVALNLGATRGEKLFNFDRVFDWRASQQQIYNEVVEPIVQQTLKGFNTCIFAYGQTGSGKTFTMEGNVDDEINMGIIPRTVKTIFENLDKSEDVESGFVKVSYLEIYNENLSDLLSHETTSNSLNEEDPTTSNTASANNRNQLRLLEDKNSKLGGKGIVIHGLEEVLVKNLKDLQKVMKIALAKRKTAATDLNEKSSRSHAIFTLTVHNKDVTPEGEEMVRVGRINLVDLAGSECVARSGSKDARAREAGNINQSLLTLGRCITALVEKQPHIPYRDSKLTRLLQDSLGGSSMTTIIATVAPSQPCLDETLSTLEYAARARSIKNRPVANQKMTKRALIKEYVEEIERLRLELNAARAKDGVFLPEERYNEMCSLMKGTSNRAQELEMTLEKKENDYCELKAAFDRTDAMLKKTESELSSETESHLNTRVTLRKTHKELEVEKTKAEERQVMIDAYRKTEHSLHSVHDSLQVSLNVAAERIELLHGKVDRFKLGEANNGKKVGSFKGRSEKTFANVLNDVEQFDCDSRNGFGEVERKCAALKAFLQNDWVKQRSERRAAMLDLTMDRFARVGSVHSEQVNRAVELYGKQSMEVKDQVEYVNEALRTLSGSFENAFSVLEESKRSEENQLIEEVIDPLLREVERSKYALKNHCAALTKQLQSMQTEMNRMKVENEELKQKQIEVMRQTQSAFAAQFTAKAEAAKEEILKVFMGVLESGLEHQNVLSRTGLDSIHEAHARAEVQARETAAGLESASQTNHLFAQNEEVVRSKVMMATQEKEIEIIHQQGTVRGEEAQRLHEVGRQIVSEVDGKLKLFSLNVRESDKNFASVQETNVMEVKEKILEYSKEIESVVKAQNVELARMDKETNGLYEQVPEAIGVLQHVVQSFSGNNKKQINDYVTVDLRPFEIEREAVSGLTPKKEEKLTWTKEKPFTESAGVILARYRKLEVNPEEEATSSLFHDDVTCDSENLDPQTQAQFNELNAYKISDLRGFLKEKGLSQVGSKDVLINRLMGKSVS